jgi:hypothetical protein
VDLRLDGDHLYHTRGVVGEVEPVASADFEHAPGEAGEQPLAMCALAVGHRGRCEARQKDAREEVRAPEAVRVE